MNTLTTLHPWLDNPLLQKAVQIPRASKLVSLALHPAGLILATLAAILFLVSLWVLYVEPNHLSPIRNIRGPRPSSPWLGNFREFFTSDRTVIELGWTRQFGAVFKKNVAFGERRLYVSDPAALHHILVAKCYEYPKPSFMRILMSGFMGRGLLFVEGETHRRQRKVVGPAFSETSNKFYSEIFHDKANELKDSWLGAIGEEGSAVIDVCGPLIACTTDVIGLAGFNVSFDTLRYGPTPFLQAINTISAFWSPSLTSIVQVALILRFPRALSIATALPIERAKAVKRCMTSIKSQLEEIFEYSTGETSDVLSLIVRANRKSTGSGDGLGSSEMLGQVSTIAIAGLETSATALTWALHSLATHPEVQDKLRNEIRDVTQGQTCHAFTESDYGQLVYLDAFVREVLRLHPPACVTFREASRDDVLPLAFPITGNDGTAISHIPIRKGQKLELSIFCFNRNKSIWGEDADEFKPERWLKNGENVSGTAAELNRKGEMRSFTAWSSTLTFLGGPRSCVGYKFAIREMKTILATLVNQLEFSPREPG